MQPTDSANFSNYTIIRLTDYGVKPDSGEDATPAMKRAIEAALQLRCPIILECPAGRYDFYPEQATRLPYYITNTASESENPDVTKTIGILLKGVKKLVLEGNGSLFIFHGKQTMFVIDACDDILIRNLHTDFAQPTVVEMTVEGHGTDYLDVRVHADSHYEIAEGQLNWVGKGWNFLEGPMQEFNPDNNTTWRIDNLLETAVKTVELEPRLLRIYFEFTPDKIRGRILQTRDGVRDQVGAFVHRSRNISWDNVGMHFMHGLGIVGQFSEDLSFNAMEMAPRPETGRTVTAFADFIHLMGCRGKIKVNQSRFIGGHDDPINVHGTYLGIISNPALNQLLVRFMHHQSYGFEAFIPGDELDFVRGDSLIPYESNKVKSAEFVNPREILLTLEQPIPEGVKPGDVVENVTWIPEVEISDNYFASIPTRGVLITTRGKVVIEHNLFEHMTMSAISVADDAASWYESGCVKDLTIRSNRFIECGNSEHPVIYIAPENTSVNIAEPVHHNIFIEGNFIQTSDALVLHAKSTNSISFKHNEVVLIGDSARLKSMDDLIHLTACSAVVIADNSITLKL
ncbi:right-handed parallel beta-helix repeat-containing protein [Paenibacillus psychroresistens]|uniref:Right-handed parallel beta-helix repeat-containing protein n=1 Tax=Paenibacillus psychroresistens TaxID=1778678 RepID=A0A6B8RPB2_9BACL|nr:right-handed parallel beta-helix repeat-containing protein [Paenibacillus psychroresistens]QGQ98201.1 right-handed parallel beta-helix repeat-containing protein [Paenibacillus psychroresistens]